MSVRKRVTSKSPVRENRTQGSVGVALGNRRSYPYIKYCLFVYIILVSPGMLYSDIIITRDDTKYEGHIERRDDVYLLKYKGTPQSPNGGWSYEYRVIPVKTVKKAFITSQPFKFYFSKIDPSAIFLNEHDVLYLTAVRHDFWRPGGVFRWRNNRWDMLTARPFVDWNADKKKIRTQGISAGCVVDNSGRNYILVGDPKGNVYKSIDGGKTWHCLDTLLNGKVWHICKVGEFIYVSKQDGVIRSRDHGKSWEKIPSLNRMPVLKIIISPHNGFLYACTAKSVPEVITGYNRNDLDLLHSKDGGFKWIALSVGAKIGSRGEVLDVSCGKDGDIFISWSSAYHGRGLYRSIDSGQKWEKVPTPSLDSANDTSVSIGFSNKKNSQEKQAEWIQRVEVHPKKPNILYIMNLFSGIHKSYDGGKTWRRYSRGLLDKHNRYVHNKKWRRGMAFGFRDMIISDHNPDHLYILTVSDGIYFSNNGGKSWRDIGPYNMSGKY